METQHAALSLVQSTEPFAPTIKSALCECVRDIYTPVPQFPPRHKSLLPFLVLLPSTPPPRTRRRGLDTRPSPSCDDADAATPTSSTSTSAAASRMGLMRSIDPPRFLLRAVQDHHRMPHHTHYHAHSSARRPVAASASLPAFKSLVLPAN